MWARSHLKEYPKLAHFLESLRANAGEIKREYLALRDSSVSDYAVGEHEKLHSGDWRWFSFIKGGEPGEKTAEL